MVLITCQIFMENRDDNQTFILCIIEMSFLIKKILSKQHKKYFYRTISPYRILLCSQQSHMFKIYVPTLRSLIQSEWTWELPQRNCLIIVNIITLMKSFDNQIELIGLYLFVCASNPSRIHSHPMGLIPSGESMNVHTSSIFLDFILDLMAPSHFSKLDPCIASVWEIKFSSRT